MNRKQWIQIALWALMIVSLPVQAVTSYTCDFENQADRDRWVINPAAKASIYESLPNKWYLGPQGNNGKGGQYGLYISGDNGQTNHYRNNSCWIFAYDTIRLDHLSTNDDYTLIFDYCGMGNIASNFDGLYLLWIPMTDPDLGDSIPVMSIPTSSGKIPSTYENYVIQLQPKAYIDYVNGTSTWKQCVVTIPNQKCDGQPHYLAFVWANGSQQAQQPGGMIDNISIMDTRPCDAPTDLKLTMNGTTANLTWSGMAAEYEVTAYSYETGEWFGPKIVSTTSASFSNLPIGQADFIVRARCKEDLYSLKTILTKLVYFPDQMCVDYLNLDNATCYISDESKKPKSTISYNDFIKTPAVDDGPANISSRHTVHFDKNEREPRTGSVAKTIPDGELASVRLGNWDKNNQAERIEYSFYVDTISYPVLLLKYLCILEAPGHEDFENPRFKLDILIGGVSIGECGRADFNCNDVYDKNTKELLPGAEEQGWHITPREKAQTSADIVWKDWTTVGVNLKKPQYQGKKVTIRLTTHDCTFSAHCGYAYFTLSCSDGKLKGMKCGAVNPEFVAPDGFAYRWAYAYNEQYREPDGKIPEEYVLGHEQIYEAGMKDDSLYVVDCMFVQDSSCYFSLYASTLATNPIAVMKKPAVLKNCKENQYTLKLDASDSWVQEIDHVTGDTLVSRIYHTERYEWNIEGPQNYWSDEVSPSFVLPNTGGDYTISLRTTCGICDSTVYYHLHLDSLAETRDTVHVVLCDDVRKAGYVWREKPDTLYKDYSLDSVVLYNASTSCDSIIYLLLTEPVRVFDVDTVVLPENLPFEYRGRSYTFTTVDTVPISEENCDTTWIINFEVYESVLADLVNLTPYICEDEAPVVSLNVKVTRGRSLRYSYTFEDPTLPSKPSTKEVWRHGKDTTLDISLGTMPYPNVYKGSMLLEDSLPQFNLTLPFEFTVRYGAENVIAQRWNDVLAIRNEEFNGGYTFTGVQWYLNGEPIDGATDFNYYTGEKAQLHFGSEYTALLTRDDGVQLLSCSFIPVEVPAEVINMPSLVPLGSQINVPGAGQAVWYDLSGRRYSAQSYDHSTIIAPSAAGYYLLELRNDTQRSIHQVMVK